MISQSSDRWKKHVTENPKRFGKFYHGLPVKISQKKQSIEIIEI